MTLPQRLALFCTLLPALGIGLAFWLNGQAFPEQFCVPWLDGCTTITATGIYYPSAYVLRGSLICTAVFCLVWWYCARVWLDSSRAHPLKGWMWFLIVTSMIGSLLLVASIAVLGEHMLPSSEHRFLWRFHTLTAGLFFLLTSMCQILMTFYMWRLREPLEISHQQILVKILLAAGQLGSLLAFWILPETGMEHGKVEAICEWWLATFCCAYFVTAWYDWADFNLTHPATYPANHLSSPNAFGQEREA